jgi:hypothetical protein
MAKQKSNYSQSDVETATKNMLDPYWRINTLYSIVNKSGQKIPFKLNWAQEELYRNVWYCNLILKARQLGISTYICLLFLDRCLFNDNLSAGIIAHTMEDGQQLFRRIKFAYDNLAEPIRKLITADNDTSQMLKFSNGSSIRVGTSLRSSTVQYLHISEFGKICAQFPDKAREIMTGSLNTLGVGQYCFIESTAEGREGYFYDMCRQAQAMKDANKKLSKLDFKFHFFPWWRDNTYRIGSIPTMNSDMHEYFLKLKAQGIILTEEQKNWYALRFLTQGEDMKREFPSTPEECWEVSNQGTYYAKQIIQARIEKRIGHLPYDDSLPVHTAWDLGFNDSTTIWYFQVFGKEVRLIDYDEGSGESLQYWLGVVKSKKYVYDTHLAPHDIMVHEYTSGMSRQSAARNMGMTLLPVEKTDVIPGIDSCRNILPRCWFDERKCEKGIKALENYRKEWDDRHGCWRSSPLHNWASHAADAFRSLATGLHYITGKKSQVDKDREKLEASRDQSGLLPGHYLYDVSTYEMSRDPFRNQTKTRF